MAGNKNSESTESAGGQGGQLCAGNTTDTRLQERAIRERWPIKPEYRQAVITRMVRIVADTNSSNREATSAAKAIMTAESQNQADEHKAMPSTYTVSGPDGGPVQHEYSGHITIEQRRTELLGIIAALRERSAATEDSGATNGHAKNGSVLPPSGNGKAV